MEYDNDMASTKKKPAKKAAPKKKVAPKRQPKTKKVDERASDIAYYRGLLVTAREGLAAAQNQLWASEALVKSYEQRLDELQGHH
jgi:hypothetical protein